MVRAPLLQGQLREAIQGLTMPSEPGLDRLIHERTRLAIMSTLAVVETVSFSQLKRLLSATDGNLSVHARKLEDAPLRADGPSLSMAAYRTPPTG